MTINVLECQEALGMRTGAISDAQITASSIWDSSHEAFQGRLNFQPIPMKSGSWSAGRNDFNPWLEVFLGPLLNVTGIATQGRSDLDQWVTRYRLTFRDDGLSFQDYRENGSHVKVRRRLNKSGLHVYCYCCCCCCCCCLVKKFKDDFKSLMRSLVTPERTKKTYNSSWCCSLRPLNTGVHLLSYGCTMDMNVPCYINAYSLTSI